MVATAVVGSAVVGGASQAIGASSAASAQTKAADQNNARLQAQYDTTRGDLAPYRYAGGNAESGLTSRLNELTSPIQMDQATLEQTPGYQFNLSQGLKSVQNSAAARGLGASGAAQKGAATYATGLADSTYQNQFNNANINQTNAYNRLMGLVQVGENAAAQTGNQGNAIIGAQTANTTGGANAQAAGYNALGQAGANVAGGIGNGAVYNGLYGSGNSNNNNFNSFDYLNGMSG